MTTVALRDRLQAGLVVAMKAKDEVAVKALRSALAAIANAEAVTGSVGSASGSSEHVAGGVRGLGAGDVPRRELSELDVADVVDGEITERHESRARVRRPRPGAAADQLRAEAAVLESFLRP